MSKYVTYLRTLEGNIERLPEAITTQLGSSLHPYRHEETLVGWPESRYIGRTQEGPPWVWRRWMQLRDQLIRWASSGITPFRFFGDPQLLL